MRRWERGMDIGSIEFSLVPVRVQIWGLPAHCKTIKMGYKIGGCLGEVKTADLFEIRDRGSFLKLLINLDSSNPLKAGIHVGSKSDGVHWVDFEYERLPQFCYSCGKIGHEEVFCHNTTNKEEDTDPEAKPLGPWMRASQFGRRLILQSNDNPCNNQRGTHSKKSREVPVEVLDLFSTLTVSKEAEEDAAQPEQNKENCPGKTQEKEILDSEPNSTLNQDAVPRTPSMHY
ncbi:Zinc knuckle CX2CX4HX4C [Sesbania bispinosa]|nr:Zinc knuckle CX2CX4HX4C [Sesbania bispinosa]